MRVRDDQRQEAYRVARRPYHAGVGGDGLICAAVDAVLASLPEPNAEPCPDREELAKALHEAYCRVAYTAGVVDWSQINGLPRQGVLAQADKAIELCAGRLPAEIWSLPAKWREEYRGRLQPGKLAVYRVAEALEAALKATGQAESLALPTRDEIAQGLLNAYRGPYETLALDQFGEGAQEGWRAAADYALRKLGSCGAFSRLEQARLAEAKPKPSAVVPDGLPGAIVLGHHDRSERCAEEAEIAPSVHRWMERTGQNLMLERHPKHPGHWVPLSSLNAAMEDAERQTTTLPNAAAICDRLRAAWDAPKAGDRWVSVSEAVVELFREYRGKPESQDLAYWREKAERKQGELEGVTARLNDACMELAQVKYERDHARAKVKRQAKRIAQLEALRREVSEAQQRAIVAAHSGKSNAERERDEARAQLADLEAEFAKRPFRSVTEASPGELTTRENEIRAWVAAVWHATEKACGGRLSNPNAAPAMDLLVLLDEARTELQQWRDATECATPAEAEAHQTKLSADGDWAREKADELATERDDARRKLADLEARYGREVEAAVNEQLAARPEPVVIDEALASDVQRAWIDAPGCDAKTMLAALRSVFGGRASVAQPAPWRRDWHWYKDLEHAQKQAAELRADLGKLRVLADEQLFALGRIADLDPSSDHRVTSMSEKAEAYVAKLRAELEYTKKQLVVHEGSALDDALSILENLASFVGANGQNEPHTAKDLDARIRDGIRYEIDGYLSRERTLTGECDRLRVELAKLRELTARTHPCEEYVLQLRRIADAAGLQVPVDDVDVAVIEKIGALRAELAKTREDAASECDQLRAGIEDVIDWAHHHVNRSTPEGTKQRGYVECAQEVHKQLCELIKAPKQHAASCEHEWQETGGASNSDCWQSYQRCSKCREERTIETPRELGIEAHEGAKQTAWAERRSSKSQHHIRLLLQFDAKCDALARFVKRVAADGSTSVHIHAAKTAEELKAFEAGGSEKGKTAP